MLCSVRFRFWSGSVNMIAGAETKLIETMLGASPVIESCLEPDEHRCGAYWLRHSGPRRFAARSSVFSRRMTVVCGVLVFSGSSDSRTPFELHHAARLSPNLGEPAKAARDRSRNA